MSETLYTAEMTEGKTGKRFIADSLEGKPGGDPEGA